MSVQHRRELENILTEYMKTAQRIDDQIDPPTTWVTTVSNLLGLVSLFGLPFAVCGLIGGFCSLAADGFSFNPTWRDIYIIQVVPALIDVLYFAGFMVVVELGKNKPSRRDALVAKAAKTRPGFVEFYEVWARYKLARGHE
jgi:hypothetical protein